MIAAVPLAPPGEGLGPRRARRGQLVRAVLGWAVALQLLLAWPSAASVPVPLRVGPMAATTQPLLVLVNPTSPNPFGHSLPDLLRAEGIIGFEVAKLGQVTSRRYLAPYAAVLLADTPLTPAQAGSLAGYVRHGGGLVAMRPAPPLAAALGLEPLPGTTRDAALTIAPRSALGYGLPGEALRFHGAASHYRPGPGTEVVATLAGSTISYPAVVAAHRGAGRAVAFAFDLARSQALASRDGRPGASLDAPVDLREPGQGAVAGVDEQRRLLARALAWVATNGQPLPRLRYFPDRASTIAGQRWNPAARELRFELTVPEGGAGLTLLLPQGERTGRLVQVVLDGVVTSALPAGSAGEEYGSLVLPPGRHHLVATYAKRRLP